MLFKFSRTMLFDVNRICCNIHLFHICEQKEQELKLISGFVQGIIKLETVRQILEFDEGDVQ